MPVYYTVRVCVESVYIFTFVALISRCKYRKMNTGKGKKTEQSVRFALDFNSDTYGCWCQCIAVNVAHAT